MGDLATRYAYENRYVRDVDSFLHRVAAKTIARLASLTGAPRSRLLHAIEGLIADATAEVLEEGPLGGSAPSVRDDPFDDDPPLLVLLSRRLGVSTGLVRGLVPRLNSLEFQDRHVVYHCLVRRMSPRDYAERFDDDPQIVQAMLDQVARIAIDG